jgi:hypothetical protein
VSLELHGTAQPLSGTDYGPGEKYFKHADEFILERWTTRPELILDKRAFIPFMIGE